MPKPEAISAVLKNAESTLSDAGISSAGLDAELLLAFALGTDRVWLHAHSDEVVPDQVLAKFESLVKKRTSRTPLVHLTGTREFYGLDFKITPSVLTPRTETEVMVDLAIKKVPKNGRLIDIGTGSGAIAVAIAHHRPDLHVTATDVSQTELEIAKANAKTHQTAINFLVSDVWANVDGQFDAVVANLPYLENEADLMPEVKHEPAVALHGGPDGLDLYRRLLDEIPKHLNPGGLVFTESDPWQQAFLIKAANGVGLTPFVQDYFILGFSAA
jgi:release factor glutamine methyltransferase